MIKLTILNHAQIHSSCIDSHQLIYKNIIQLSFTTNFTSTSLLSFNLIQPPVDSTQPFLNPIQPLLNQAVHSHSAVAPSSLHSLSFFQQSIYPHSAVRQP